MAAKTTHIVPKDRGWAVKREGSKEDDGVYATQKEAIAVARGMTRVEAQAQIVVHGRDGSIRSKDIHGLPVVQRPPGKSKLGRKAIEKAVSKVIRERLTTATTA